MDNANGGAGGLHAESHANGVSKSVVKLASSPVHSAPAPVAPVPQQPAVLVANDQPQLDTRGTGNEIIVTKTVTKKKYVPEVRYVEPLIISPHPHFQNLNQMRSRTFIY